MRRHSVMELFLLIDEQRREILELQKENAKLEAELQELKLKNQKEVEQ